MGFTEKLHAYIAARFYVRLTHTFGEKGKAAFIHATQYYAEQRGRRMAKRAIADGQPLTYETYRAYGEWTNTEEMKAAGCANRSEVVKDGPDWEMHIFVCPWHAQFREMGLAEAGDNDEIIRKATVPAATIKVGYYTNTQENILLNRDDYRTRIADGIMAAIEQAYDGNDRR